MNQQSNRQTGRGGYVRNVLFAEIIKDKDLVTQGTGTATTQLVGPVFKDIGQYLGDIVIHGKGRHTTNGFTYDVKGQYSYDGETWEDFGSTLMSVSAANVGNTVVSNVYTTRTNFGRHIRLLVIINDSNTGVATAQLSLAVAFHFLNE